MAEEEFKSVGISPSYGFLMMAVITKPGIQPTEISEQLQLTPSTITRLIEKLEFKGLLERRFAGRSTRVYATTEGKKTEKKIKLAWRNLNERYTKQIGIRNSKDLTKAVNEAAIKLEEEK